MSYILDALKKLENEKARKSRGTGMLGISGDLFRDEQRNQSGNNIWKIAAVVLAASLVTFGATWFVLKNDKARDIAKPNFKTELLPARTVTPQVLPGPSQQTVSTATPNTPLPALPDTVPVRQADVVKTNIPSATERQSKRQNIPKKQMVSAATQLQPVVPNSSPPPDIKVSGIAWQDEHSARRAVVNGFLMREGGSVSGAKIAEIYQDRVLFSQDGKVFEVYLLAAGLPVTAK